jgi:acyl-CoA thioester hydrolase
MLRLDRTRLNTAIYPDRVEIPTRIDDLDVQGHVNNVAVAVILQEARGRFNKGHVAGALGGGLGLVVASQFIEYAGQMYYPDPVEVSVGVLEIGRTSYLLGQIARQNGRIAAYAETTLITIRGDAATPFPDTLRAALEAALVTFAARAAGT